MTTAPRKEYEKIPVLDEWVEGTIARVEIDPIRRSTYKGEEKIGPAVRLWYMLNGMKDKKPGRWMTFSYGKLANLYTKYLSNLVEDAHPDMEFQIEALEGLAIKTMWKEEKGGDGTIYQNLELIKPLKGKIAKSAQPVEKIEDEEPPF